MSQRILVIEDEKDIRESLMEALESEGYTALSASNGLDAISMYEGPSEIWGNPPDLILLDLLMPRMNGATFLKQAKENRHLADVPIVLMSADHQTAQKATEYGADAHLHKPLGLDDLFTIIATTIEKQRIAKHSSTESRLH